MPDPLNMASSGKKGKKSKGKTVPLNDFLQDGPGAGPAAPVRKSTLNWADEVEDSYDPYESRNSKQSAVVLPTAPKAARGIDDFSDKIPQSPPYIAYLSNLPYDVEENEIADFFRNLKISNMKIPREDKAGEGSRVRGFGYVEFEDQESLIEALAKPSCMLKGRRIRIEVATNSDNERRKGGRMDMNRDRGERPEAPPGDWRTGGRKEPESSDRRPAYREGGGGGFNREGGGGGFNREGGGGGFGRDRDRGEGMSRDRETSDLPGAWRDATERPSFKDNDRYERRGDSGMSRDGGMSRDNRYEERRGFGGRRNDREESNGGFGRKDDGGGYGRRDDGGGYGRRGDDGGFRRDDGGDREPRTRPKLNLVPRSVPTENPPPENKEVEDLPPKPTPVPAASIFGAAKPVDTSARERQIEERLAKQTTEIDRDSRKDDDRRRDDRGRRSPDRRRYSPRRSPNFRRDSPDRRRGSPDRRRGSPDRRRSPEYRRDSPDRRRDYSDNRRGDSSDRGRSSPDRGRSSPDNRRDSPEQRRQSPGRRRGSPDRRRISPDRRQHSPDRRRTSPPRKRNDDKRGPPPKHDRDRKPREYTERDMPKLKTPEPVKIIATNQYAFLDQQEESDSDEK